MLMNILYGAQAVISVLMIVCILVQSKGQGLSVAFGGSSAVYRSRRGAEKLVFNATIVLSILFAVIALVIVILSQ